MGTAESVSETGKFFESIENRRTRATVWLLVGMLVYQGYTGAIITISSPWIARSFALNDSHIARVFAFLDLAAFGSLALSRMVDRRGRRKVLIWSAVAIPVAAFGAATAPTLAIFVVCGLVMNAFLGAAAASAIVILAEILPIERRAKGQSWAGLAGAAGSGFCIFLTPILVSTGMSWRWLLIIASAGILIVPMVARIPESARWELMSQEGEARRTRFYDVFVPLYRKRSITLIVCALLAAIASEGVNSWAYFHAVSGIGLSATVASTLTLVSGGLGMLGFPIGAWSAERYGRVPTVVVSGIAGSLFAVSYFWGPPRLFPHPALWLGGTFLVLNACANALLVSSNAAVTELFPTAMRATMIGWFLLVSACGSLFAEATISVLSSHLGGLSVATGWLCLLGVPSAVLFAILIDETRGMTLESSAREDAFERVEMTSGPRSRGF